MKRIEKLIFNIWFSVNKLNNIIHMHTIFFFILTFTLIFGCTKEPNEINIGMIIPLTGSAAEFGEHERNVGLLVQEKINNSDGINGSKIKLTIEDSQGDPKSGVNALRKMLLQDKPIAIYSELSVVSLAIAPIAEKENLIMISVAANPALTNSNRYAFRNFPDAERQAKEMAFHTYQTLGIKKLSIFYIHDDFGIGLKDAFEKEFKQHGGMILSEEPFETEGSDFRTEITKLIVNKPDGIYIVGYGKPLGIGIKQLRELGYKGQILSGLEVTFEDVLTIARNAADGVIYLDVAFDNRSTEPHIKEFVEKYRTSYTKEPSMVAAMAYDGLNMLLEAIRNVGEDPEMIRNFLMGLKNYRGVCGKLEVNANRDIIHPLVMKEIKDGVPIIWRKATDIE